METEHLSWHHLCPAHMEKGLFNSQSIMMMMTTVTMVIIANTEHWISIKQIHTLQALLLKYHANLFGSSAGVKASSTALKNQIFCQLD